MDQRTDVFEDVQAIRHKLKVSVKNLRNLVESLTTNSVSISMPGDPSCRDFLLGQTRRTVEDRATRRS